MYEKPVCMCYTITVKQKTQRLVDEFSYSFIYTSKFFKQRKQLIIIKSVVFFV